MAVTLYYVSKATIRETLTNVEGASNPVVELNAFDSNGTLTADTTPPVTKGLARTIALSGGAYTIDLTTITGTNGATQDMTGLKVQVFRFKNQGAAAMTIAEGASNGYAMLGAAFTMVVPAGGEVYFRFNDNTPDVASGDRTIDITGTSTQEFDLTLVAG